MIRSQYKGTGDTFVQSTGHQASGVMGLCASIESNST
jgi:hypothetical protein